MVQATEKRREAVEYAWDRNPGMHLGPSMKASTRAHEVDDRQQRTCVFIPQAAVAQSSGPEFSQEGSSRRRPVTIGRCTE